MKYTKNDLAFLRQRGVKQHTTNARMDGKVCVVTGATSGVGLAAARRLAQGGAQLVLVARNRQKAEAVKAELDTAHPIPAEIVIADFERLQDVRAAAAEIGAKYPVVDLLINCAGVQNAKRELTADGNETTFQVNHLAGFLLEMLLIENLSKSQQGRILLVNSEGHRFGGLRMDDLDWSKRYFSGLRAYGAAKLAQLLTMHTLSALLNETRVTINAMHPGTVGTYIGSNNGPVQRGIMAFARRFVLKPPTISGEALYYLAAAPELKQTTDRYFYLTVEAAPNAAALDEAVRSEIWKKSLELTGLTQVF